MDKNFLPVEAIQERDIDLILLEELATDISFGNWFVEELDLPELVSIKGAWKSISAFGLGETDILFSYHSKHKKIFVLIENKLDASFQNGQFNRYNKRKEEYLDQKECDEAYVVLIAPQQYCENQDYFSSYLTYEAVAKRLELEGTKRSLFKRSLLNIASKKLRRGYQAVNSIEVSKFWQKYWINKEDKYPNFRMKKPDVVPYNSDWPMMIDERLNNVVFYHKLGQGNVDATFKDSSLEMQSRIRNLLPEWAILKEHEKSFSIRVFSGKINRTKDFDSQIDAVDNGLHNLEKIRNWIIENKVY